MLHDLVNMKPIAIVVIVVNLSYIPDTNLCSRKWTPSCSMAT